MDTMVTITREYVGQRLSDVLFRLGIPFSMPCGGEGRCGGCRVTLLDGSVIDDEGKAVTPDENGEVAACRVFVGDAGCKLAAPRYYDGTAAFDERERSAAASLSMALDIGTTTLSAALVDTEGRRVLAYRSSLNPQVSFGADVMRRIEACERGKLFELQAVLLEAVRSLSAELLGETGRGKLLTVVGNPTMLHLFLGVSPVGMGKYPFTPQFLSTQYREGRELFLPFDRIVVLPSASAFVGSDVIVGVYALGMAESDATSLLLDLGTNGEMALLHKGRLFVASCAAGPAFEGGEISMGMGGVGGAVSRVYRENGGYAYETVGELPARGICGAGLCDLVALLCEDGVIDDSGYLALPYRLCGARKTGSGTHPFAPSAVVITPEDVRRLQLAKAAVAAGLTLLCREASLALGEVKRVSLAGGFGQYLSPESARRIGLLPQEAVKVTVPVGNTALRGAILAAIDEYTVAKTEALCEKAELVSLAEHPDFARLFTDLLFF